MLQEQCKSWMGITSVAVYWPLICFQPNNTANLAEAISTVKLFHQQLVAAGTPPPPPTPTRDSRDDNNFGCPRREELLLFCNRWCRERPNFEGIRTMPPFEVLAMCPRVEDERMPVPHGYSSWEQITRLRGVDRSD